MTLGSHWQQITKNLTGTQVLNRLLTVDGTGSGLDADLLDGYNSSATATADTIALRDASGELAVATPTADTSATTKAYVDAKIEGLVGKGIVDCVATANVASLSGVGSTVDGITLADSDIVLLTAQTTDTENGTWVVASGAWARPDNFAAGAAASMAFWLVDRGTTYADTRWWCTTDSGSDVVGTDTLTIERFSGAAEITAGDGLTKTGNTLAVDTDVLRDADVGVQVQAYDDGLASIAGLTTAADKMIYATASDTYAVTDITSYGRSLVAVADEAAFKALVNLETGTDVQAYDATLNSIAALGTASDKLAYTTGVDTWAEATLTSFARSLLDDADASTARGTLGLGTIATQAASSVAITGGTIADLTSLSVTSALSVTSSLATFSVNIDTAGNDLELGGGSITSDTDTINIDDGIIVTGNISALNMSKFVGSNGTNRLELDSDTAGQNQELYFSENGTGKWRIGYTAAAGDLRFRDEVGGTEFLLFDQNLEKISLGVKLDTDDKDLELGSGSITSDTGTVTVDDILDVSTGVIRATGSTTPASGAGVEISFSGSVGYITSYDRGDTKYENLEISAGKTIIKEGAVTIAELDRSTGIKFSENLTMDDGKQIILDTTTGTEIGTATSQKLGLWGATPVVQPSTTGTTTGFTAGSGTGVNDDSTFTGNTGTKAYTIGDIVYNLKQCGILAAS
jgi:hypothetical protein